MGSQGGGGGATAARVGDVPSVLVYQKGRVWMAGLGGGRD